MLPKLLFRGDNDKCNKRQLKSTLNSGVLLTNLCNGGNGREIFSNSLGQLVYKHIGTEWDKTHFLSFSCDEQRAFYYGGKFKLHEEVYDIAEPWDFAVLTFDTATLIADSIKEIDTGIYSAIFNPTCKEFLPIYNVILIDAYSHLTKINSANSNLTTAIENADRDKEWLILPANPFGNNGELTSKLDTNCIIDKRVFRYE